MQTKINNAAESGSKSATLRNRDTAPKITKLEYKIATYKLA